MNNHSNNDGGRIGVTAYSKEGSDELRLHSPEGKRVTRQGFRKLQQLMPSATFHLVEFKDFSKVPAEGFEPPSAKE